MALISVTTEKGNLYSESYKNPKITSENLILMGISVSFEKGIVTAIDGSINKKSSEESIGYFSYNNSSGDPVNDPANVRYNSSITINKKEDAFLQVEATNALLAGIAELEKTGNVNNA